VFRAEIKKVLVLYYFLKAKLKILIYYDCSFSEIALNDFTCKQGGT